MSYELSAFFRAISFLSALQVVMIRLSFPLFLALQILGSFFFPSACLALEANELLVVANRNDRESVALAQYYMRKRGVPGKNLLKISVTDNETCSRADYDRLIARPIREKLEKYSLAQRPRCVVTVRGVPLRISEIPLTEAEQAEIAGLKAERELLNGKVKGVLDEGARKKASEALSAVEKKIVSFESKQNTGASVDSELMLVPANEYPLSMWVANPFFMGFNGEKLKLSKNEVVMVSRLDAPTPQIVRRIIDDAIAAEKDGLTGTACFDARYKDPGDQKLSGYALYDKSIHLAALRIREKELMPVVLDDNDKLFKPGECPRAALYCGWYSLARYVDAFDWVSGAVGYHIASAECRTLRQSDNQIWCKRMLEEGAAVTIGPVDEPYVQAFPLPEIFFRSLTEWNLTVAESYLLSVPYLSWKMVLVGDPLYRPFRKR